MPRINYHGSLGDYKESVNANNTTPPSPPTTYPEGFTPGAHVWPKGFTPGASVPKQGGTGKPPKSTGERINNLKKLNADPNLYRKAQDYSAAMSSAANAAMATGDVVGAGMATSKGDKASEYVQSGRKNVGKGINSRRQGPPKRNP